MKQTIQIAIAVVLASLVIFVVRMLLVRDAMTLEPRRSKEK
jgi:hypothetical protein